MNEHIQPRKPVTAVYIVTLQDERKLVEAEIHGNFAIHVSEGGQGWTLTHIGSGYALATKMPRHRSAIELAQALGRLKIDWEFADKDTTRRLSEHHRRSIRKAVADANRQAAEERRA